MTKIFPYVVDMDCLQCAVVTNMHLSSHFSCCVWNGSILLCVLQCTVTVPRCASVYKVCGQSCVLFLFLTVDFKLSSNNKVRISVVLMCQRVLFKSTMSIYTRDKKFSVQIKVM